MSKISFKIKTRTAAIHKKTWLEISVGPKLTHSAHDEPTEVKPKAERPRGIDRQTDRQTDRQIGDIYSCSLRSRGIFPSWFHRNSSTLSATTSRDENDGRDTIDDSDADDSPALVNVGVLSIDDISDADAAS